MNRLIIAFIILAQSLFAQTSGSGGSSSGATFNYFDPCANSSIGMEDSTEKCSFRTKFETYLNGLTPSATTSPPDAAFASAQTSFDTKMDTLENFYSTPGTSTTGSST